MDRTEPLNVRLGTVADSGVQVLVGLYMVIVGAAHVGRLDLRRVVTATARRSLRPSLTATTVTVTADADPSCCR